MKVFIIILLALTFSTGCNGHNNHLMQTNGLDKNISTLLLAEGISIPWAMVQLPSEKILVTEHKGELRVINNGQLLSKQITGLPKVHHNGQGLSIDPRTNNI